MPASSSGNALLRLPLIRSVDILVIGASSGAVAAALAAQERGRSAMVVSEFSYLGEEAAGTLNLWPAELERSDALLRAMFPADGTTPALPGPLKHALECSLLQAGVPFLYLTRPIALLRDGDGQITGAILATRTSLFAVRCRAVIDATRYGVVAQLAGTPMAPRAAMPPTLTWTVLADGVPAGWESQATELHPPFRQLLDGQETTFGAYRLSVDRTSLGDDPRAREHVLRSALLVPNVLVTADVIADVPSMVCAGALGAHPARLADGDYAPLSQLFLLNGLLPLTEEGLLHLERSDVQVAAGRRVGALAAENLAAPGAPCTAQTGGECAGAYGFAPAFLRRAEGTLEISPLTFPQLGRYDVAVAGGGTGGAPAGIAAARAGAKTVVLETQHGLGGVSTLGLIASYYFGNRVGFTTELDEAIMALDAESRQHDGQSWRPEIKSAMYHRMLQQAGGAAWAGSYAFGVRMAGDRVDGLLVSTPFGSGLLDIGCVVDATGNADIAAAAGAPCRVINSTHVAVQGVGLSPRPHPGVRHYNSDFTFIDDSDPEGVTAAFVHARAKFPHEFDTAPLVDSRERRQIHGEIEISPLDILAGRTFPDTVVTARSNFDTHGFIVHPLFMVAEPDHASLDAHVPFRCMLPKGVEGVLATGLGMSAHRDALPVLRMQADVQNQGYAAGLAAATAAVGSRRLRDLDIRALQRQLADLGIIAPAVLSHEDSFPFSDEAIRRAADGPLTALMPAAILLAHPAQSRPLLQQILQQDSDPTRRRDAAVILGLLGSPEAAPVLAEAIAASPWDEGWNYRGMGQFGASMSRLDVMILALARTGWPADIPVLAEKIRQLGNTAHFSHYRAVALASALLQDARLAAALADVLRQPGMQGHAQTDIRDIVRQANGDPIETEARNLALRELYLARGLYLAGDVDGLGHSILTTYTLDVRGHFARHARGVLEDGRTATLLDLA